MEKARVEEIQLERPVTSEQQLRQHLPTSWDYVSWSNNYMHWSVACAGLGHADLLFIGQMAQVMWPTDTTAEFERQLLRWLDESVGVVDVRAPAPISDRELFEG